MTCGLTWQEAALNVKAAMQSSLFGSKQQGRTRFVCASLAVWNLRRWTREWSHLEGGERWKADESLFISTDPVQMGPAC